MPYAFVDVDRLLAGFNRDVTALVNAGLIDRVEGKIEFPYEAVHVDFMLRAA